MPIFVGCEGIRGNILHNVARVEQLAADLELIARGEFPSDQNLSSAPVIDAWMVALRPVPCLIGTCSNHPRLNGPVVTTTDLWVFAPDLGWAKTLPRFCRLGTSHPEGAEH